MVDTPDFATQLASLIGLGVGIDYSLFVVTRYRAEVRNGLDRDRAVEMAIDTAGRTVMFAAITVVIALLGLLLLGLSFMQGVALGAATAVLATMLAALTIIPALIGGSGNFIDGVLHEFDERGGFRFWGTKRRLTLPGHDWRSRRAVRRDRKRAEGAGWERWSHMVQRRPWIAVVVALAVLIGAGPARAPTCAWAPATRASIRPARRTRKAYDLIAEGFGAGTNGSFLLVAQLAQKGDKAAAQQIADGGARRQGLHLRRAARGLPRRPGGHDQRLPADRPAGGGDDRHAQAPARRASCPRSRARPTRVSRSAASRRPTRTSRASWPTSCRSSSASSCCSARCCCSSSSAR